MEEYFLADAEETACAGERMARELLETGVREHAALVALSGDLGAGKTTFVKGFARALGVSETIQSPTFIIAKYYAIDTAPFSRLVHIDAYRLEAFDELRAVGWEDIARDPHAIILMEWPEKVSPLAPEPDVFVSLSALGEGRKMILHKGPKA